MACRAHWLIVFASAKVVSCSMVFIASLQLPSLAQSNTMPFTPLFTTQLTPHMLLHMAFRPFSKPSLIITPQPSLAALGSTTQSYFAYCFARSLYGRNG